MSDKRMKLVLVTPEIPFNTGAIGRTCVALDLELILIKPYGFSLDEKSVVRAGTRYWKHVQLSEYDSWQGFLDDRRPLRESLYLFEAILDGMDDRIFNLPMRSPLVKSLNLANVATAVAYQAMRTYLGG
jgi:tRNA (cytidine/uridine-2'-O-)-methyltransferase